MSCEHHVTRATLASHPISTSTILKSIPEIIHHVLKETLEFTAPRIILIIIVIF